MDSTRAAEKRNSEINDEGEFNMRMMIALMGAALIATPAMSQVHVKGYVKSDGTYVAPHYRSNPNSSTFDNYSTKGNVNPYTGKVGTVDPYRTSTTGTYPNPYKAPKTTVPCYFNCPE